MTLEQLLRVCFHKIMKKDEGIIIQFMFMFPLNLIEEHSIETLVFFKTSIRKRIKKRKREEKKAS